MTGQVYCSSVGGHLEPIDSGSARLLTGAVEPRDGYQYATILAALVAPLSRGTVTLKSADIKDLPIINAAYLQSPTDQKVAIAAYKRLRQAWASSHMQQIVIGEEYYPGPKIQTDDEILEVIKNGMQTVWHASCTCKMGKEEDEMAVVDSHARVYGVKGLRVVDASAFPFLPPGHPQSCVCRSPIPHFFHCTSSIDTS